MHVVMSARLPAVFITCIVMSGLIQVIHTVQIPEKYITQARCEAFCRNKYGSTIITDSNTYDDSQTHDCSTTLCQKCLLPCKQETPITDAGCSDLCNVDEACLESCQNLRDMNSTSLTDHLDLPKAISKPTIVCKNVPYTDNSCSLKQASIYIKWEELNNVAGDVRVYVISSRYRRHEHDNATAWIVKKIVPFTFLEMDSLMCEMFYQFAVTMVTEDGRRSQSRVTNWSKTLRVYKGQTPTAPISMNIDDVTVEDQRPTALVTWDTTEDASCYYRIFVMSKSMEEEEIKAPREFRYKIKHLEFSTNYSIYLYAYDDKFRRSSKEILLNVLTPDCLSSTLYNYSVCAPLPADNLTIEVLTKNHEEEKVKYVNLSLFWNPPPRTHKGSDIQRYYVEYRKEPLIRGAYMLEPDKGSLVINSSDTFVVIDKLHNHNHYSFSVIANTKGGNSTPVKLVEYIGLERSTSYIGSVSTSGSLVPISNELVAIVLSCAFLIIIPLVIVFIILLRRRNNNKGEVPQRRFGPIEEMNPIYERASPLEGMEFQQKLLPDDYEIDYSRLDFISVIGEGAFGKVVKAEYRPPSENGDAKPPQIVAVKMLKEFYTGDESRNFLLEIQAMKNLGHHPYIVSIIGSCMTGPKLCLIMDYCAFGDLRNYLRKYREKMMYNITSTYGMMSKPDDLDLEVPLLNPTSPSSPLSNDTNRNGALANGENQIELTEGQLLSYARQITMGMEFLEDRKFIHRDLAARNILLCDERHLKISDFGLTRDVYETNVYQPTSARKLPYKWMAIESLFSQRFTIKSDVWSFGIVLWEIVTLGGSPYPSIPLKDLYGLLKDGYRMEKPDNCSPKLFQIMLACWHPNPNYRPAFSQLRVRLEKLLEETQSYIDLSIEVSNDYFNESTSGSHPPLYPNSQDEGQASSCDITGTPSELSHLASSKELYVDIHDNSDKEVDSNKLNISDETESQNIVDSPNLCSDSQIYPVACENCSFHMENNRRMSATGDTNSDTSKQCQCVLCVNKARSMDNRVSRGLDTQFKSRGSVKSSLRNIIDKVSAKASDNLSKPKKRSASLSDMYTAGHRHESQSRPEQNRTEQTLNFTRL